MTSMIRTTIRIYQRFLLLGILLLVAQVVHAQTLQAQASAAGDFTIWVVVFGVISVMVWVAVDYTKPENVALRNFNQSVEQKNFGEALKYCEEGLLSKPDSIGLLVNASAVCIPLKEFEKTLEFCNRGLTLAPKNTILLCNRSAAFNNLARYEEAVEDASKAISIEPKLQAAYLNRAFAYLVQRKYSEAISDCKNAQSMNLIDVDIIHAESLNSMNKFEEALDICQKTIEKMQNESPDAELSGMYVTRGNIHHGMRKPELAIADFDEAIRLNPRCEPAYVNRSGSYLMLGDLKKAQDELDNLARMKISESLKAYPMYTQIRVHIKKGEWEKAQKVASMALEKYPASPIVNSMVAFLELRDKKNELALGHINKAIELDKFSREAHFIRSEIYQAMGEQDKASDDKKIATDFGYVPYLT